MSPGEERAVLFFYIVIALTTLTDQLSKLWIRMNLAVGEDKPFWGPFLSLSHYQNTGAAGSSFQGYGRYFIIVGVLFVGGALYYRWKGYLKGFLLEGGAAFLVGGAIGNTVDRILFGKVTDFLVFGTRNGVMNMADLFLNVGVVLILADLGLNMWKNRFKPSRPTSGSKEGFVPE